MPDIDFNDYFYYDETSPSCLRWKVSRWSGSHYSILQVSAGDPVSTVNHAGYFIGMLNRKVVRVHRVIWTLFNGEIPKGGLIDHEDRVKSNNKIDNLRLVTTRINGQNCKMQKNNTSGVTGVYMGHINGRAYWQAGWQDGKYWKRKSFSISKYGSDKAFQLACEYRTQMLLVLNSTGQSYTALHGTSL